MELKGILGWMYKLCNGLMYVTYLNLLWIVFCLAGLAFFPSTVAMFSVTRNWVIGKKDAPIFQTFWNTYKKEFWKSQCLGLLLLVIGVLLYVNFEFFSYQSSTFFSFGKVVILSISFIYSLTFLFFFPVYGHFQLPALTYIKNSILFVCLHFVHALIILMGEILFIGILLGTPALIFVFGGSLSALWITWISHKVFRKVELKMALVNSPAA
jgi:uncharacterized membrane protein YesL